MLALLPAVNNNPVTFGISAAIAALLLFSGREMCPRPAQSTAAPPFVHTTPAARAGFSIGRVA